MKLTIDTQKNEVLVLSEEGEQRLPLYSREGFEALSALWVKVGWNEKYSYTFSWFGRPIIQLPEDMVRMQEVFWRIAPDIVIETGVAHGGSLVFYASLLKAMGRGRVVGIDIEIRPKNRVAIEQHPLGHLITLVEGSSINPQVVATAAEHARGASTTLIILDSNHTYAHVLAELRAYAPLVTVGSYLVATDGVMRDLADVPRGNPNWLRDNPAQAAADFAKERSDFVLETPAPSFNDSALRATPTHWPDAWLRRVR